MAPRSWVMTIKRNPILMFCFFQNLKRVRIRQALKLRLSNTYSVWDLAFSGAVFEDNSDPEFEEKLANTYSVWDLAFSGAVFGDNSDQADSDFDFLVLRAILENLSGRMLLEPLSAIVSAF